MIQLFLYLPYGLIAMVLILPISYLTLSSFIVDGHLSLEIYYTIFTSSMYLNAVLRSIVFGFASGIIVITLSFPVAYAMCSIRNTTFRNSLLCIALIHACSSFFMKLISMAYILEDSGALVSFLRLVLFLDNICLYRNNAGMLVASVYIYLPYGIFLLYNELKSFDHDVALTATSMVGPWAAMRRVILPSIAPGIANTLLLITLPIMMEVAVPEMIGGRVINMGYAIWLTAVRGHNAGLAGAMLVVTLTITIPIVIVTRSVLLKRFIV